MSSPNKNNNVDGYDIGAQRYLATWEVVLIAKAIQKGIALHWDNPDEIVGDAVAEQMFFNVGLVEAKEGNLTKIRFAKILEKLGLL